MDKTELTEEAVKATETGPDCGATAPEKKKFRPPEISVPVDVLKATTFFQLTDSGSSN